MRELKENIHIQTVAKLLIAVAAIAHLIFHLCAHQRSAAAGKSDMRIHHVSVCAVGVGYSV